MSMSLLLTVAGLALLDSLNPATILGVALILVLPGRHQFRPLGHQATSPRPLRPPAPPETSTCQSTLR